MSNEFVNYVGKSDPSLWGQVPVRVMCHTRELAFQISKEDERFSKFLPAIKKLEFFFDGLAIAKDEQVTRARQDEG